MGSRIGGSRGALWPAFVVVVALFPMLPERASGQGLVPTANSRLRAGVVGFSTGDDVNCPTGIGVAGGGEVRTQRRLFVGLGADLYVATPAACTSTGTVVPHESGTADEFSGITLLFAPRLTARVGGRIGFGDLRFEPSLSAGGSYAPQLWGESQRRVVPWTGGALGIRLNDSRFGLLIEHGFHRVPVSQQVRETAGWRVVNQFGRWKPATNVSLSIDR
jgi:hypothetical protein